MVSILRRLHQTVSWEREANSRLYLPKISGRVQVYLDDELAYEDHNIFVNRGYAQVAQYLAGNAPTAPDYVAVGNGDGTGAAVTPAGTDTTLGFEVLRKVASSRSVQSTYTTRISTVFTSAEAQGTLSEMGLFDEPGDNGTSSGSNTTTTLNDNTKAWTTDQWANWTVYITGGTGSGQKRTISSNTATALTVSSAWTTTPDNTSTYTIGGATSTKFMYARASISITKGAQSMTVIWQLTQPSS